MDESVQLQIEASLPPAEEVSGWWVWRYSRPGWGINGICDVCLDSPGQTHEECVARHISMGAAVFYTRP